MMRRFSKAYGLAGLRVGYAVAREEIAGALHAAAGPYPVSSASIEVTRTALEIGGAPAWRRCRHVEAKRDVLARELTSMGAAALASQGNFVLARFEDSGAVWRAWQSAGSRCGGSRRRN